MGSIGTPLLMSAAGLVVLVIGLFAAKNEIAEAGGVDKIVALANVCFAIPLAVFGAEHFAREQFLLTMVPSNSSRLASPWLSKWSAS